jgi:hypothetical protein
LAHPIGFPPMYVTEAAALGMSLYIFVVVGAPWLAGVLLGWVP